MRKKTKFYSMLFGSVTLLILLGGCGSDSSSDSNNDTASKSNAGVNQLVNSNKNAEVKLDGSKSTSAKGSDLSYAWSFTSRPDSSTTSLTSSNSALSSFFPDKDGIYTLDLTVTDASQNVSTSNVDIIVMPVVAFSGPDQAVKSGATVQLDGQFTIHPNLNVDGTLSFPTDGISFLWSIVSMPTGSTATISDTTIVNPTFVADKPGPYIVKLVVDDGIIVTSDEMHITAHDMKAVAGEFQFVDIDTTVQLDGSASWNINGSLTYAWTVTEKPISSNAVLLNADTVNPTFVADVEGEYFISLSVSDGVLNNSDEVFVVVMPGYNLPIDVFNPSAFIGGNQTVKTGTSVILDGSASLCGIFGGALPVELPGGPAIPGCAFDPAKLSFTWSFVSMPTGSTATMSDVATVSPTFTADIPGDYLVKLVLDDGSNITTDEATITATDLKAVAGFDLFAARDGIVQLDGTQSWNLNGDIFYSWSFTQVPVDSTAVITNNTTATPTFTPDVEGGYEVKLTISDGGANSDSDLIVIHSFPFFPPPLI